jgi:uncharacterized protein YchJ
MYVVAKTPTAALPFEVEASAFYHRLGYRAVILDEGGYVRHIGADRHVVHPGDTSMSLIGLARNAPCPCGSGRKLKHCHGALA